MEEVGEFEPHSFFLCSNCVTIGSDTCVGQAIVRAVLVPREADLSDLGPQ